jgi:hypothetical protein
LYLKYTAEITNLDWNASGDETGDAEGSLFNGIQVSSELMKKDMRLRVMQA